MNLVSSFAIKHLFTNKSSKHVVKVGRLSPPAPAVPLETCGGDFVTIFIFLFIFLKDILVHLKTDETTSINN